jgi:hypothetical protein
MRVSLPRSAARAIAIVSAVFAIIFAVAFSMIRSNFAQRSCDKMPAADWVLTPNCTDAYNGIWFSGMAALACILLLCWSFWRLRRA